MAIYKSTAGQKIAVFAYDKTSGAAKTGDAANITAYISKDWGTAAAVTDTNPTELDSTNMPGWYVFDLTQAETNAEVLVIAPKSATANILLEQVQVVTADSTVATAAALATVDSNVDAILDDTGTAGVVVNPRTVEGAIDEIEALRLLLAGMVGKASGGGTATVTFRDTGDTKDRIILTVDSSGNRSAVTLDAS